MLVNTGPGPGPRKASQAASASLVGKGRVSRTLTALPLPSTATVPASWSRSSTSMPTTSFRRQVEKQAQDGAIPGPFPVSAAVEAGQQLPEAAHAWPGRLSVCLPP